MFLAIRLAIVFLGGGGGYQAWCLVEKKPSCYIMSADGKKAQVVGTSEDYMNSFGESGVVFGSNAVWTSPQSVLSWRSGSIRQPSCLIKLP
jgi:hypothetical protein